jgi:hypothetical protein
LVAAGYLLFFITAGAFMFEAGQAVVCAVRRYRWKPAGTPKGLHQNVTPTLLLLIIFHSSMLSLRTGQGLFCHTRY